MERQQSKLRRHAIVRQYVADLTDDTEKQVCFLYQLGHDDAQVCRRLNLVWSKLLAIKVKLALELLRAGLRLPREV